MQSWLIIGLFFLSFHFFSILSLSLFWPFEDQRSGLFPRQHLREPNGPKCRLYSKHHRLIVCNCMYSKKGMILPICNNKMCLGRPEQARLRERQNKEPPEGKTTSLLTTTGCWAQGGSGPEHHRLLRLTPAKSYWTMPTFSSSCIAS